MRKYIFFLIFLVLAVFISCRQKQADLYTFGIFQMSDVPHLNEVRRGFIQALEDGGFFDGNNMRLVYRNALGNISEIQRIAKELVQEDVDMLIAVSTQSLQAALHATKNTPIVFSSVANPYLAGAGRTAEDHLENVTGVSSRGPIKESLRFIKTVLPDVKRIGTIWTPTELNSEYYLDLVREGAAELGFEIVAVPVANKSEVLLSAQVLVNKQIDAIYQISDNTINASFEAIGRVAEENGIPLFGGFLASVELGASAALGWNFFDMGYKAGQIAISVMKGTDPADIPFQYMEDVLLHINLPAAQKQGVHFSEDILAQADKVIRVSVNESAPEPGSH
ncbi:MAG: ABC transporter substrate-binding protein [Candidatus Aminicenantes bacterium]|nr:ABC transporter substrate-binding protein [Candidatus Aminicenantes bacterium]